MPEGRRSPEEEKRRAFPPGKSAPLGVRRGAFLERDAETEREVGRHRAQRRTHVAFGVEAVAEA